MPSQYKLYPNMSPSTTLSCQNLKLGQALGHDSGYSLRVVVKASDQRSTGRRGRLPASVSSISLIDLDIDTSDFMNMKSAFPWDENQPECRYNDSFHPLRHSFESTSSTIQGSYWSMKTRPLPNTDEAIAEAEQSRQSILIPDYPQDLASHHIETYKSRPADLRTSSADSAIPTKIATRNSPLYKRSATPSQLDFFAGALVTKSNRGTHAAQQSFESNYSQNPLITPSLAFSSTTASSPPSSIMYSRSTSGDTLYSSTTNTGVLKTENSEKRLDARSSGQGSMRSGPKQAQDRISGPLPNADYPSAMHPTISSYPLDIHNPEEAFQPRRKTPNPPVSIPPPLKPRNPATLVEPASWWDLDDDISEKSSKHLNLPTKLSIPHLRLRAESSTKKTISVPAPTIKRQSEDSITIATNIVETPFQSGIPHGQAQATAGPTAHISCPSPIPNIVQDKLPRATLKKKYSFRSKLLVPVSGCSMKTSKTKKGKMLKVGSSSQARTKFSGQRLRALFRRVFGLDQDSQQL
jgi:hypothetical protein